jgi:acetyltransferase-like isoleucine patch superfamily enzyme
MLFCLIFFIFSKKIVMFIGRNIVKHGKNFTLGEYVIIKKPELVEIGDNVRISDFCRISSACVIGSDCEIAPGTYISGGDGKFSFKMGECSSLSSGVRIWLSSNDYVNELVTHSLPEVKEIQGNVTLGKYTGVGANSVIMPNNDIPDGVCIGALSFVPSNYQFEPWTVYAGRPIRPIKKRNKENVMKTLKKIGYIS